MAYNECRGTAKHGTNEYLYSEKEEILKGF